MARFRTIHGRWFVLERGDDTQLLTWKELTKDWYTAGFEVIDWFRAPNRTAAEVMMRSRGELRGYLSKGT